MTEPVAKNLILPLDYEFACNSFERIAAIRAFETKAWSLTQSNPPRVAGSMHFCAGQEAVPVGAIAALGDDDQIIATYRGHGWALAAGIDERQVMAEVCHKATGLNGGRAGSAYLMAPHTRFIGENSIVGAGATIACGIALANRATGAGRVVVVSIGDGALNQGSVHEALAFAAAQSLAVIFIVENNGWSELTPTSAMFRDPRLARRASGYGIGSATIDGTDPIAVRNTIAAARRKALDGTGPCFIECRVPRLWGHYHRDIEHYRPTADKREAERNDPLIALAARLEASAVMSSAAIAKVITRQTARIEILAEEIMLEPNPDPATAFQHVVASASVKVISEIKVKEMTYVEAVNVALRTELETEPKTLLFGEDIGPGNVFGATRNLQRDFGVQRVFDTPIAENAILGGAVGAALAGMKPIVEIMWLDFILVALDQLVNQAANVRYVTQGRSSAPLVVRTQQGATPGSCAQHSQVLEALVAHIPGLKVAVAGTPDDAYALLRAAAADPDPCVVIEARALYADRGRVRLTDGAEPIGRAALLRDGTDIGIVTWGAMVPRAMAAAAVLEARDINAAVLNLRWLSPLDEEALIRLAARCGGRILIVHEAVRTGGFGAELAMRLLELSDGRPLTVRRLTTPDSRIPASPVLQNALIPSAEAIAEAATDLVGAAAVSAVRRKGHSSGRRQ